MPSCYIALLTIESIDMLNPFGLNRAFFSFLLCNPPVFISMLKSLYEQ